MFVLAEFAVGYSPQTSGAGAGAGPELGFGQGRSTRTRVRGEQRSRQAPGLPGVRVSLCV